MHFWETASCLIQTQQYAQPCAVPQTEMHQESGRHASMCEHALLRGVAPCSGVGMYAHANSHG